MDVLGLLMLPHTFYSEESSHLFLKAQTQDNCICYTIKAHQGRMQWSFCMLWLETRSPSQRGKCIKIRLATTSCAMFSLPSAACSNSKNNWVLPVTAQTLCWKSSAGHQVFPSEFPVCIRPSQPVATEFPTERTAFLLVVPQCFQRNCMCQTSTSSAWNHGSWEYLKLCHWEPTMLLQDNS